MPSFGLLKEQILTSLQEQYTADKNLFRDNLKRLVVALGKSPTLTEMFLQYNNILKTHMDDADYAKDYLEEAVDYLRTLKLTSKDVALLESLQRKDISVDQCNPYVKALDTLVFTPRKHLKEHLEAKRLLTQKLVTENATVHKLDPRFRGMLFEILKKKIEHKMSQLNEQELLAIESFAEQDAEKVLANYIRLIDDNVSAIDEQFTQHGGSSEHFARLKQAKQALIEMKENPEPSLGNLERLLVLREGFKK